MLYPFALPALYINDRVSCVWPCAPRIVMACRVVNKRCSMFVRIETIAFFPALTARYLTTIIPLLAVRMGGYFILKVFDYLSVCACNHIIHVL